MKTNFTSFLPMNMAASLADFFLTTTFSTSQSELLPDSAEAFEAEEML